MTVSPVLNIDCWGGLLELKAGFWLQPRLKTHAFDDSRGGRKFEICPWAMTDLSPVSHVLYVLTLLIMKTMREVIHSTCGHAYYPSCVDQVDIHAAAPPVEQIASRRLHDESNGCHITRTFLNVLDNPFSPA
jgi:hypothetical protein